MTIEFGDYPLKLASVVDGLHTLADESVLDAEQAAIPQEFSAERLEIMTARAFAYGFKFVFPEVLAEVESEKVSK